jgi:hypothetical protein
MKKLKDAGLVRDELLARIEKEFVPVGREPLSS